MAVKLSGEVFAEFFWEKVGPEDQNWPYEDPEHHKIDTHPADVVFQVRALDGDAERPVGIQVPGCTFHLNMHSDVCRQTARDDLNLAVCAVVLAVQARRIKQPLSASHFWKAARAWSSISWF